MSAETIAVRRKTGFIDEEDEKREKLTLKSSDVDGQQSIKREHVKVVSALAQVASAQWLLILGLIFGGCCSNVFALEAIVREHPTAGNLITLIQFLFVALEGYIHFFSLSRPPLFIAKPHVPFRRYAVGVTLFFLVSVLNNFVWKYHISIPVHIIFRSGGALFSIIVGFIAGKSFSKGQIISVVVLTSGVICATLFDAKDVKEKGEKTGNSNTSTQEFAIGIFILFLAQVLSAVMSQINENTYKKYGSYWRENLFYMHFLTIPLFLPAKDSIIEEFRSLSHSNLVPLTPSAFASFIPQFYAPQQLVYLFLNAVTQYLCVRGVNNLAGNATAVTVTIVLNVRKCVSLLLSIYLFGNKLPFGTCVGAALVFGGAAWYSIEISRLRESAKRMKST
ncbi:UAA transporter [Kockiozyma suomiensis]|uniref:UAA transporter n=1 Tax=Kockiozyma suomiensis TaxID=1337062 RepID=UPI0033432EBF